MKADNLLPILLILLLLRFCYCAGDHNATLQHGKDKVQQLTQPILPFQGQITAASLKLSSRVEISGGGDEKKEHGEERGLRRRSAKSSGSSGGSSGGGTGGVGGKGGGKGTSEGGANSQSIRQPREQRKSLATRSTSTSSSCSLRWLIIFRLVLFFLLLRR